MARDPEAVCSGRIPVERRKNTARSRVMLLVCVLVWFSLVATGLWLLFALREHPHCCSRVTTAVAGKQRIQPARDHSTLVMLAHPHCPCTKASIGELAAIMAHCQGRLTAYVLFIKPEGFSDDWEESDLWQAASRIPGVKVLIDDNGDEARLFHAARSGQTVLYDSQGHLNL